MDRKSIRDLRLDWRLLGRRGWIASDELEGALEALPDVSAKAAEADAAPERPATSGDEATG